MRQAMIFAAGLGTRLKPITDRMPKALVPVDGQPLLWHVIHRLQRAGMERIVVNVHHFAPMIIDYLKANGNFGMDIRVSDESDELLETGGGIRKAMPLFDPDSAILIHNVDILSNAPLEEIYDENMQADALLLVSRRKTARNLLFDENMKMRGWINKDTGEVKRPNSADAMELSDLHSFAFSGIHVISPRLVAMMESWPRRFPIIDFYICQCAEACIKGRVQEDLKLLDVGKLSSLDEAEAMMKELKAHR